LEKFLQQSFAELRDAASGGKQQKKKEKRPRAKAKDVSAPAPAPEAAAAVHIPVPPKPPRPAVESAKVAKPITEDETLLAGAHA
jgi:hypothetical protein